MDQNRKHRIKPVIVGNNTIGNKGRSEPSAAIQIDDDNAGFLPSRLTTEQRDAIPNPAEGLMIFNVDTNSQQTFQGGRWATLMARSDDDDVDVPFPLPLPVVDVGRVVVNDAEIQSAEIVLSSADANTTLIIAGEPPNQVTLPPADDVPDGTTITLLHKSQVRNSIFVTDNQRLGINYRMVPGSFNVFVVGDNRWFGYFDSPQIQLVQRTALA